MTTDEQEKEKSAIELLDHDLRNSLSVIYGNAHILVLSLEKSGCADEKAMAGEIASAVDAILAMLAERMPQIKSSEKIN